MSQFQTAMGMRADSTPFPCRYELVWRGAIEQQEGIKLASHVVVGKYGANRKETVTHLMGAGALS